MHILHYVIPFTYPSSFIDKEYHKFFFEYTTPASFLTLIENEKQLFFLRNKLLGRPTTKQSQMETSIATADLLINEINEASMPTMTAHTKQQ